MNNTVVSPSEMFGNRYFVFRINGVEVTIDVITTSEGYQKLIADKPLLKSEWDYFNKMVKSHEKKKEDDLSKLKPKKRKKESSGSYLIESSMNYINPEDE